jgi:hypothetical protein
MGSNSKFLVRLAGLPSSLSRIDLTDRCDEFTVEMTGPAVEGPWKHGIDGAPMVTIRPCDVRRARKPRKNSVDDRRENRPISCSKSGASASRSA